MSTENDINLFDSKDWNIQENSLFLIAFNVYPATREYTEVNFMPLISDNRVINNYKYKCRYIQRKIIVRKI